MRKELMDEYRSLNCFIKGGAPDMLIRKYHPSDCPRLAKLFYQTVHEVNKQDYTKEQLNAWATGEVDLSAWNHSFLEHYALVAVEGDEILGFGDIDETGYLDRLYVHKDHQREGIASRLCDKLEAHVSGNIRTHASITAKPFFQNRGYKIIKEQQVERRGIPLTNFVMELEKKWEKPAEEKNLMKKVIVIGSPGAGKSTFSRKLRTVTGLPLYHLDMIWHKPDKTNISREELVQEQKKIMENQSWIIDGNYLSTMELRLENCDTIFLLDYPLEVCLAGAKARIGTKREDIPWLETEFDEEFRQWILDFPKDQLPVIYQLLEKYGQNRNVHIFRSRDAAENYLKENFSKNEEENSI